MTATLREELWKAIMRLEINQRMDYPKPKRNMEEAVDALELIVAHKVQQAEQKLARDALAVDKLYPGGSSLRDYLNLRIFENTTPEELKATLQDTAKGDTK